MDADSAIRITINTHGEAEFASGWRFFFWDATRRGSRGQFMLSRTVSVPTYSVVTG